MTSDLLSRSLTDSQIQRMVSHLTEMWTRVCRDIFGPSRMTAEGHCTCFWARRGIIKEGGGDKQYREGMLCNLTVMSRAGWLGTSTSREDLTFSSTETKQIPVSVQTEASTKGNMSDCLQFVCFWVKIIIPALSEIFSAGSFTPLTHQSTRQVDPEMKLHRGCPFSRWTNVILDQGTQASSGTDSSHITLTLKAPFGARFTC